MITTFICEDPSIQPGRMEQHIKLQLSLEILRQLVLTLNLIFLMWPSLKDLLQPYFLYLQEQHLHLPPELLNQVINRQHPQLRTLPNPHVGLLLGVDALRAVCGPGIDCKHGTGSSSPFRTDASHLSRNSCSPAARGAHTTSHLVLLQQQERTRDLARCARQHKTSVSQR